MGKEASSSDCVIVQVPANIALIKYWGKRNEELILPLNDSISLTIDGIWAQTRVTRCQGSGDGDSVTINGTAVDLTKQTRFRRVFDELRRYVRKRHHDSDGVGEYSFKVDSITNFPVAAGLASSAAGFGALAYAFGAMFSLDPTTVSRLARLGSGSACRSVFDGLVRWHAGVEENGLDSTAERLFPLEHWSDLRAVIIVLNASEKETGSTKGMQLTATTSALLKHRVECVLPERIEKLIEAYRAKDFATFAELTMRDSNQFHAVCMDTYPPLKYMNELSWEVIRIVNDFNTPKTRAAYTFDAGPNACVFLESANLIPFLSSLQTRFELPAEILSDTVADFAVERVDSDSARLPIEKMIVSTVGVGPKLVQAEESLIR